MPFPNQLELDLSPCPCCHSEAKNSVHGGLAWEVACTNRNCGLMVVVCYDDCPVRDKGVEYTDHWCQREAARRWNYRFLEFE